VFRKVCWAAGSGRFGIALGGISPALTRSRTFTHSAKLLVSDGSKGKVERSSPPVLAALLWQPVQFLLVKADKPSNVAAPSGSTPSGSAPASNRPIKLPRDIMRVLGRALYRSRTQIGPFRVPCAARC